MRNVRRSGQVHTEFRTAYETDQLEDLGIDWRIILKWIFEI
jgi:hypothetical protein